MLSTFSFDPTAFNRVLALWFAANRRDLPWRQPENARDAYRVLVSETMLQQTTVKAVVPFYERFITRFPDVCSLAHADLEEVLPLWAGLGYYSRARMLHRAAQEIVARHDGVFPVELNRVLDLPGIGRYTAGAVTSIAFDARNPIVDANVARVFSRLFLLEGDLKNAANQSLLWNRATQVVESCNEEFPPSVVNPAMMELGALVCTPKNPACEVCPVSGFCGAFKTSRQSELPFVAPKRQSVALQDVCAFATRKSKSGSEETLLRQRSHDAGIWWRGLWELPRTTRQPNESAPDALRRLFRDELELEIEVGAVLRTVSHGVTHHKISLECWSGILPNPNVTSSIRWFAHDEIAALALPSSMKSLLSWLHKNAEIGQGSLF